jgi:single-strand DNA-binding protein
LSDINSTVLTGRLTRDPELRSTNSGTSVANTAIAVERFRKDQDNDVSFIDLTIWGNFAELVANKARKGDTVTISGRLQQERWETEDGSKRSKVVVVVDTLVGECMYRKADGSDTPARTEGNEQTAVQSAAPAASDDDIPF